MTRWVYKIPDATSGIVSHVTCSDSTQYPAHSTQHRAAQHTMAISEAMSHPSAYLLLGGGLLGGGLQQAYSSSQAR